jgi:hypothetical protein
VIDMQIPFPMLKGPSGAKAAALLGLLAGLAIVTAIKNQSRPAPQAQPQPAQRRYEPIA